MCEAQAPFSSSPGRRTQLPAWLPLNKHIYCGCHRGPRLAAGAWGPLSHPLGPREGTPALAVSRPDPCPVGPSPLVPRQGGFSPAGWFSAPETWAPAGAGSTQGRHPGSQEEGPRELTLHRASLQLLGASVSSSLNGGASPSLTDLQRHLAQLRRGSPDLHVPLPAHLDHPGLGSPSRVHRKGLSVGADPLGWPVGSAAPLFSPSIVAPTLSS